MEWRLTMRWRSTVRLARRCNRGRGHPARLNICGVYVTGASSGGYMATQLQVAYSDTFQGAGIFTAGPYYCGTGNLAVFTGGRAGGRANCPVARQGLRATPTRFPDLRGSPGTSAGESGRHRGT